MSLSNFSIKKTIGFIFLAIFIVWNSYLCYEAVLDANHSTKESDIITQFIEENTNLKETASKIVVIDEKHPFSSYVRKTIGHYGAYGFNGLLGFLAFFLIFGKSGIGLAVNLIMGLFTCCLTELLQFLAGGRAPAVADCTLNYAGYLTAVTVLYSFCFALDVAFNKKIFSTTINRFAICAMVIVITEIIFLLLNSHDQLYLFSNLIFVGTFVACFFIDLLFAFIYKLKHKKLRIVK